VKELRPGTAIIARSVRYTPTTRNLARVPKGVCNVTINMDPAAKYLRPAQQFCGQCLSSLNLIDRKSRPSSSRKWKAQCTALVSVGGLTRTSQVPILSQTIQIFVHPFSSFPPLKAIKKIAHTPAARARSTTKVCILKPSFVFRHGLMASQSIALHRYGKP
jgi:hypothetical protein